LWHNVVLPASVLAAKLPHFHEASICVIPSDWVPQAHKTSNSPKGNSETLTGGRIRQKAFAVHHDRKVSVAPSFHAALSSPPALTGTGSRSVGASPAAPQLSIHTGQKPALYTGMPHNNSDYHNSHNTGHHLIPDVDDRNLSVMVREDYLDNAARPSPSAWRSPMRETELPLLLQVHTQSFPVRPTDLEKLSQVYRKSGLDVMSVPEALNHFTSVVDTSQSSGLASPSMKQRGPMHQISNVTREQFEAASSQLPKIAGLRTSHHVTTPLLELFDAMDIEGSGALHVCELAALLSVFCRGAWYEKMLSVFTVHTIHSNSTGGHSLAFHEVYRYIRGMLRATLAAVVFQRKGLPSTFARMESTMVEHIMQSFERDTLTNYSQVRAFCIGSAEMLWVILLQHRHVLHMIQASDTDFDAYARRVMIESQRMPAFAATPGPMGRGDATRLNRPPVRASPASANKYHYSSKSVHRNDGVGSMSTPAAGMAIPHLAADSAPARLRAHFNRSRSWESKHGSTATAAERAHLSARHGSPPKYSLRVSDSPRRVAPYSLESSRQAVSTGSSLQVLKRIRFLAGLEAMNASRLFVHLNKFTDSHVLSRHGFEQAILSLPTLRASSPQQLDEVLQGLSVLFRYFDRDADGAIDMQELMSGVASLCAGDTVSKQSILFNLCDSNADGQATFVC
jgi:EF hand